jgi:hypothetical protein
LVLTTNQHGTSCDRPQQLAEKCDPGSRFQVLTRSDKAYVVAHCCKGGLAEGRYKDLAVIQYNQRNGDTCFYQALGNLSGRVKAPMKGMGMWGPGDPASYWISPADTAKIGCGACHDNGAILRSPYLAQLKGANQLPGAGDETFNSDEPYCFVGEDFASWKVYSVEVDGNKCNKCHRMGVSNIPSNVERDDNPRGFGTSRDFGIRATAEESA